MIDHTKITRLLLDEIIDCFLKDNPRVNKDDIHYRYDRCCLEWICKHGCGHPFWDAYNFYGHGCCGCCKEINIKNVIEKYKTDFVEEHYDDYEQECANDAAEKDWC